MVVEIDPAGGRVRLGITAPDDVKIYRQEIWVQIQGGRKPVKLAIPEAK